MTEQHDRDSNLITSLDQYLSWLFDTKGSDFTLKLLNLFLVGHLNPATIEEDVKYQFDKIVKDYSSIFGLTTEAQYKIVAAFMSAVPDVELAVIKHIVKHDDIYFAQNLKVFYYAQRPLESKNYIKWLSCIIEGKSENQHIKPNMRHWLSLDTTRYLLSINKDEVFELIYEAQDMELLHVFIENSIFSYKYCLDKIQKPNLLSHLLDTALYRKNIVANTEAWIAKQELTLEQKWQVIEANLSRVSMAGSIQEMLAQASNNYYIFADNFQKELLDALLDFRYSRKLQGQEYGIQKFIEILDSNWSSSGYCEAIMLLAFENNKNIKQILNTALQHDDLELFEQLLDTIIASGGHKKEYTYWILIDYAKTYQAPLITEYLQHNFIFAKMDCTLADSIQHLIAEHNTELCKQLIKSKLISYIDALEHLHHIPEYRKALLNIKDYQHEMLSNHQHLLDNHALFLTPTHMQFIEIYSDALRTTTAIISDTPREQVKIALDNFLTICTYISKREILETLLLSKSLYKGDIKYFNLIFGDIDLAIILLNAELQNWDLLQQYIIDYDDVDLLKQLFHWKLEHPELKGMISYMKFLDVLKGDDSKIKDYLRNPSNVKGIFSADEIREHIFEKGDTELCDIVIENRLLGYHDVWILPDNYIITRNVKKVVEHLLDYKKYAFHISYYREYLIENAPLNAAIKLAIKQPYSLDEAVELIEEFKASHDTQAKTLMLLEQNIYKIFAITFENSDAEGLVTHVIQNYTPLIFFYASAELCYRMLNAITAPMDQNFLQPVSQKLHFAYEVIYELMSDIPETLDVFDAWDKLLKQNQHLEIGKDLKSLKGGIHVDSIKAHVGKVVRKPEYMTEATPKLRQLLSHLQINEHIYLDKKKKIIMNVVQAILDEAKRGRENHELVEGNDLFGIGGGINECIMHPSNYGINMNHPLYKLLYMNPVPIILDYIPGLADLTESLAGFLYPRNYMPVKIIPSTMAWYNKRSNDLLKEEMILEFYIENSLPEVWHHLIKSIVSPGTVESVALDVFLIITHGHKLGMNLLQNMAQMVVDKYYQFPSMTLNMAHFYYGVMSNIDWTCYEILAHQHLHTQIERLLFLDRASELGSYEYKAIVGITGINPEIAESINKVQYDDGYMVKLAYFVSRCKFTYLMEKIIPTVQAIVSKNQNRLVSHIQIPLVGDFAAQLLETYIAPVDYHIKPFGMHDGLMLMDHEEPKLEIVRDVILHNNPVDVHANDYIAAAAKHVAPTSIIKWLISYYAKKFNMIPLNRASESERHIKTMLLAKDMTVWTKGALHLMEKLYDPSILPTALELTEEIRYEWWSKLRFGIGEKISSFFDICKDYFDSDQYAKALVVSLAANFTQLRNDVPIKSIFNPAVREQAMIGLSTNMLGAPELLKYMIYNDMAHAKEYKFAAFRCGQNFYNSSVRPIVEKVMQEFRDKIIPPFIYNPQTKQWQKVLYREKELFHNLDLVNQFDGQDKLELWGYQQILNTGVDMHTTLYRAVQAYIERPIVLSKIMRDDELVKLMLQKIDQKMIDPGYRLIYSAITALDVIQHKMSTIYHIDKRNNNHAEKKKLIDALETDLCGGLKTIDFISDGHFLDSLEATLSPFPDVVNLNVTQLYPPTYLNTQSFTKFQAVQSWILSMEEAQQAETLGAMEFIANYYLMP